MPKCMSDPCDSNCERLVNTCNVPVACCKDHLLSLSIEGVENVAMGKANSDSTENSGKKRVICGPTIGPVHCVVVHGVQQATPKALFNQLGGLPSPAHL